MTTLFITQLKPNPDGKDCPPSSLFRSQFAFWSGVATTQFHRFMLAGCLIVLILTAQTANAQPVKAAIAFQPGDTLRLVVTLKERISFDRATASLCIAGERRKDQETLPRCIVAEFKKQDLAEHTCEFSTLINNQVAVGEYRLEMITITTNGHSREFKPGPDFQAPTPVQIESSGATLPSSISSGVIMGGGVIHL